MFRMATSYTGLCLYVLMTVFTITWSDTAVMPGVEGFEGETVTLPCTVTQQLTLRWRVGSTVIATKPWGRSLIIDKHGPYTGVVNITGEFNLRISSLYAPRDNGQFTCEDSSPGGGSEVTTVRVFARITRASIQEANNGTVTATAGKPKTLTCKVTGYPSPRPVYTWIVDDGRQTGQGLSFNLTVDKSTKNIKCRATNRYNNGSVLSTAEMTATLDVLFLESPSTISPITVVEKENVSLLCSAEGNPPPAFEWRLSGTTEVRNRSANYIIENVKRSAAGEYTCTVSNSVGSGQTTVTLVVQYPPEATLKVNDKSRTLSCEAHGIPDTYTFAPWEHLFGGKRIRTMEGITTGSGNQNSIQLWNWSVEDTGHYVCSVSNGMNGLQRRYIYLKPDTPAIFMEGQDDQLIISGNPEKLMVKFYISPPFSMLEWKRADRPSALTSHTEHVTLVDLDLHGTTVKMLGIVSILALNSSELEDGQFTVTVTNFVSGRLTTSQFKLTLKASKSFSTGDGEVSDGNHGGAAGGVCKNLAPEGKEISGGNNGGVVGAVVGSVSALILISVAVVVLWKRRTRSRPSSDRERRSGGTITDPGTVTGVDSVGNFEMNTTEYETLHVPDEQTRGENYDQLLVVQKDLGRMNTHFEKTSVLTENRPELTPNIERQPTYQNAVH